MLISGFLLVLLWSFSSAGTFGESSTNGNSIDVAGLLSEEEMVKSSTALPSVVGNMTSDDDGDDLLLQIEGFSTVELSAESTSRRPHFQFKPQFEHSSYDFMVPEGTNPKSIPLAVISYMGKKGRPMPLFKISFDRMRWFEIGEIVSKELDDYVEYKVMINQRALVYVQYSLTKSGSYKFSVEAHDDGSIQTADIRVDVLSLSPTTRRSTTTSITTEMTTVSKETTSAADALQTTTPLMTTTTVPKTSEDFRETQTVSSASSEEPLTTTSSENESSTLTVVKGSTDGSSTEITDSEDFTLVALNNEFSSPQNSSEVEAGIEEGNTSLDNMVETTAPQLTSEDISQLRITTPVKFESTEAPSTVEDTTTVQMSAESTTTHLGDSGSTEEESGDSIDVEVTGKGVADKSELSDATTPSTEITTEPAASSEEEELDVVFNGTQNGTFKIKEALNSGDLVRGLTISVRISPESKNSYTKLSLDNVDAVEIRPKLLFSRSKAHLFVKDPSLLTAPLKIKIMAERSNAASIKELTLVGSTKKPTSSSGAVSQSKGVVVEHSFSILEDSPSGTTVGQIKGGESKRVVGPPGLFSLLGSDLILSCPNEGSCLDYEKEQVHHVLLVDVQGKKSPPIYVKIKVEDVNDNRPRLEASDNFIRLSNNKLIMPFILQVIDEDEPTSNKNKLSLSGTAANFLAVKEISPNLYQVDVVGFAPSGHHQLEVTVSDEVSTSSLDLEVHVQNSRSHAHFRRTKYSRSVTADKIHQGNQLVQVELEGVPIDEARFLILQGNPGWLSIDDYGGRVGVAKLLSPVETGSYVVEIGAVDRESNALLAQTQLEIRVIGGAEPEKKMFSQSFFTRTLDRESSPEFLVRFKLRKDSVVVVESLFALDENGQQKEFKKSDVSIDRHSVSFKRGALGALRVVSVELASEGEKATVTLSLSSTPQFIENQRKESTRPLFPHPWTRESPMISLSIPEELPLGTAVFSLPAVNPVDGTLVSLSIHGDMKDFFAVDSSTGSISIAQRLDVDSMPASDRTFSLRLVAGADDYESEAVLRITLVNIDDNAPILEKGGLDNEIPIPENLPPLTTIARFAVGDRDELDNTDEFTIEKSGLGSQQYSVSIVNGSLVVAVAANGTLDREQMQTHTIHLTVRDAARNQDSATLHVLLLDENDNAPRFSKDQYAVQVVDNWPVGVVIDRLFASDDDTGNNANVVYSLASGNRKYFAIEPVSGELSVSGELAGAAREQPYELVVLAEDSGVPSLSTSVRIKLKVSEPTLEEEGERGQVHLINPPVEFVLEVKEDTPVNEHVYMVKARLAGMGSERTNIKYSLKDSAPNSQQHFGIDESSGEVYVTSPLDYEQTNFFTLVVTAWNVFDPSKNASRLLRVVVEDVDDIAPEFLKSGMMLFTAPHSTANSDVVVGKVSVANDRGPAPHYYLMPTCAEEIGHFSIDGRSGEISVSALAQSGHKAREEFCVFASSRDGVDVGDLAYDAKNASMIRAAVEFDAEQAPSAPLPGPENNTVTVIQENMRSAIIPVTSSDGTDRGIRYSLENVQFTPVQNSSAAVLTGGPSLFFVNPRTGETRANPALADQPQGIYTILINAAATNPIEPPRRLIKKFHYVKDEMKLRYVLSMAPEEFATERKQFSRRLQQALKVDHPEGNMEVFLAEPRRDNRNATRTTVCFHAVMNEQVQSEKSAILALSQPTVENSELSRLYHHFQVVNIERCEETLMALRQSAFQLPMQVLLLVAGVALLLLLLIALITYICFVQRYKEHLRMKQSQLKLSEGTPSPLSYSPTFILPPVGPRYGYY